MATAVPNYILTGFALLGMPGPASQLSETQRALARSRQDKITMVARLCFPCACTLCLAESILCCAFYPVDVVVCEGCTREDQCRAAKNCSTYVQESLCCETPIPQSKWQLYHQACTPWSVDRDCPTRSTLDEPDEKLKRFLLPHEQQGPQQQLMAL